MNIFAIATRKKFRFESSKGLLTVEQLWDLKLLSPTGFDLQSVAQAVNAEVKAKGEEDFVGVSSSSDVIALQKLEVVKEVIAIKKEEALAVKTKVEKAEKRAKILDAIQAKDEQALSAASKDELLKQLADLDA